MSARSGPKGAHDLSAAKQTLQAMAANVAAITPYLDAVAALDLGPQPLMVDGQLAGDWDPLGGSPGLESALQSAQQHVTDFQTNVMVALGDLPGLLATISGDAGGPGVVSCFAQVQAILGQLQQSGNPPSAAMQQEIESALTEVLQMVTPVREYIASLATAAATFLGQTSGDHQALAQGDVSVQAGLDAVRQAYQQEVLRYVGGPGGDAIANVLGAITAQVLEDLQALDGELVGAVGSAQGMTLALGHFQDLFTALGQEYGSMLDAVQRAEGVTLLSVLMELNVQDAQSFWEEASAFAQTAGL